MKKINVEDLQHIFECTQTKLCHLQESTIFILGGTGFIGRWLLEAIIYFNQICSLNIKIIVLSRNPQLFIENNPRFGDYSFINFIKGDLNTFDLSIDSINYIIFAASELDDLEYFSDKSRLEFSSNGLNRVIDLALNQINLKKLLYTSSGAIYGNQPFNVSSIRENDFYSDDKISTSSTYSQIKRNSEKLLKLTSQKYGLNIVVARCFSFIGPYLPQEKNYAAGNFVKNFLNEENIEISGNGHSIRSYLYASDLTVALLNLLINENIFFEYNIGSSKPVTISALADIFENFSQGKCKKNILGVSMSESNYVPDIERYTSEFGQLEYITLENAVSKTIDFYR